MFGVSFTEIAVIALITLIFVGPQKLPSMLYTLGRWIRKLRELTTQVRAQTGIDEILRQEGFEGGLGELRNMLRGDIQVGRGARRRHYEDPYEEAYELDQSREYPPEGADVSGAVPDDLVDDDDGDDELDDVENGPVPAPEPELTSHPAREPDPPWKREPDAAGAGDAAAPGAPEAGGGSTSESATDAPESASAPKSGPRA